MERTQLSGQPGMVVVLLPWLSTENTHLGVPKRTASPAESGLGPDLLENLFIGLVVV